MFPSKKLFFIVLAALIALMIVSAALAPYLSFVAAGAFWLWAIWGGVGAIIGRVKNRRKPGASDRLTNGSDVLD